MTPILVMLLALALDRWWGEPPARWHPVVWMGAGLSWWGARVAPRVGQARADARLRPFLGGAAGWCVGAAGVALLALGLQWAAGRWLPAWAAALVLGLALKSMLAWRMLREEVLAVEAALAHSVAAGRVRLARLVSRDVTQLDDAALRESALESLAENLNDSVVAPLFWFLVAGLPGAALYRFANTADAMWGYREARNGREWQWAGKWAARADDLLSWLPARITAGLLALAAGRWPRGLRAEAARTPSPNSGWPMAAMALLLGRRLGKPGVYVLHAAAPPPQAADVPRALRLASRALAWGAFVATGVVAALLVHGGGLLRGGGA